MTMALRNLLVLVLLAYSLPVHASLPDDVIKEVKANDTHFSLAVDKVNVRKLAKTVGGGDSVCEFYGYITKIYNLETEPQYSDTGFIAPFIVDERISEKKFRDNFKVGGKISVQVPCSENDYPIAPGMFCLPKDAISARLIEFWGGVGWNSEIKNAEFQVFDAKW